MARSMTFAASPFTALVASVLALSSRPLLAQLSGGVSISGFFDVVATNPRNDGGAAIGRALRSGRPGVRKSVDT
jgi:hypothetical protein